MQKDFPKAIFMLQCLEEVFLLLMLVWEKEGRKITSNKKEIHAHGNVFQILHLSFKVNKIAFIYSYHFYTTVNKNIP